MGLPDLKTCYKFSGKTEVKQVEGHYEKRNALPKMEKMRQTGSGGIMKNEVL
jgi:hypothetical protein